MSRQEEVEEEVEMSVSVLSLLGAALIEPFEAIAITRLFEARTT